MSKPLIRWLLLVSLWMPGSALADVQWLYSVEVPVNGQSAQDRQQAAGIGLLQVLTRITGLTSVPRNAAVAQAIANPARFYSAFDFVAQQPGIASTAKVRIVFQRDAVLDLIEQAALPVWWEERPSVLVWIVLQEGGQRRILTGADKHPLVNALNQQADRRGLRVQLPMMDLQDALAISAADVWGRVSTTIDRAGVRYAPEVTVVGRFNVQAELGITRYAGQWEVWGDATNAVTTASAEVNNADVDSVGKLGVNALAQMLTEQYAVLPRGQRQTRIQVSNVQSAGDYASLLRYLDGLTFVRQVDVDQVQGDNLLLRLHGQAEQAQLEYLLTRQKKLQSVSRNSRWQNPDLGAAGSGAIQGLNADIELSWQG